MNRDGDLAFVDSNGDLSSKNKVLCHWYRKPTDTRILLSFCSFARTASSKKNMIPLTIHWT